MSSTNCFSNGVSFVFSCLGSSFSGALLDDDDDNDELLLGLLGLGGAVRLPLAVCENWGSFLLTGVDSSGGRLWGGDGSFVVAGFCGVKKALIERCFLAEAGVLAIIASLANPPTTQARLIYLRYTVRVVDYSYDMQVRVRRWGYLVPSLRKKDIVYLSDMH